jgi:hypothetical protein
MITANYRAQYERDAVSQLTQLFIMRISPCSTSPSPPAGVEPAAVTRGCPLFGTTDDPATL